MTIALLEALTFGLGRLVDAASQAGHRLCLLTSDRSIYAHELRRLRPDRLDVLDVDTGDVSACETALRRIPDLAGIISSTDTWALPGAELAARLGLPGPDIDTVRTLRDKGAVRALLHRRGLSRATAIPTAPTLAEAERVATAIGFPLVLKDSAGTSSRAVWLIRDEHELGRAVREAQQTTLNGHLIAEPFFAGPVYSAETLTWQGRTRLLGVLSRQLSPEPLRREEAASFPVAFPPDERAALERWITRMLAAAGYRQGFAHTEFVLTTQGPEVVEINGRIGGALVGEALCRSLDTNVYTAMISMALGEHPTLLDDHLGSGPAVAFVLIYAPRPGTLTGWSGLDRLSTLPGNPEWFPTSTPGDRFEHLSDQRGCTGIVLTEGPTAELAMHRALSAAGGITPVIHPAPAQLPATAAVP
ncbi:hypothetical protein LI90_2261 [Carbonactinospora thermoautotrophica]|uniref:ATP-grasp domain-containing protein n=1 Tax=Carbonactinospora thermoautotrophica TaxID=1469144 RepID=A0A132MTS0_9ACTN|nr:ATP-grasp domain-containing protein [Carbonactinospora thermoautotrophica]KWX01233.1 hypothetical protein LI90_2261 [Carbonactinospora thermoautotrophica]